MRHTLPVVLMTLLAAAPALAQTPAAAPSAPLRIGGQTKAPERIHYVAPAYPAVAMAARVSGTVIIEATIDKEGSVTEARVLRSIATLDQAALNAVKQWKYKPTTIDGKPVPVIMTVSVNFTPPPADDAPTAPPAPMPPSPPAVRSVPQAPPAPVATEAPQAPKAPPAPDPNIDRSDANIRLTLSIADAASSGTAKKTVTLIVANMGSGRVRSSGSSATKAMQLDVDAAAELRRSGLVKVNLTIFYQPENTDEGPSRLSVVNESIQLFLKDNVPTVISQSADPTKGSRSVTVEVTAQVMK